MVTGKHAWEEEEDGEIVTACPENGHAPCHVTYHVTFHLPLFPGCDCDCAYHVTYHVTLHRPPCPGCDCDCDWPVGLKLSM